MKDFVQLVEQASLIGSLSNQIFLEGRTPALATLQMYIVILYLIMAKFIYWKCDYGLQNLWEM